ncbi:MAG: hypothetical protein JXX14_21180 [Deltaproteobacteria bacterium]|nr:hypothetical protein [Deltaproteobacteria bacterium]
MNLSFLEQFSYCPLYKQILVTLIWTVIFFLVVHIAFKFWEIRFYRKYRYSLGAQVRYLQVGFVFCCYLAVILLSHYPTFVLEEVIYPVSRTKVEIADFDWDCNSTDGKKTDACKKRRLCNELATMVDRKSGSIDMLKRNLFACYQNKEVIIPGALKGMTLESTEINTLLRPHLNNVLHTTISHNPKPKLKKEFDFERLKPKLDELKGKIETIVKSDNDENSTTQKQIKSMCEFALSSKLLLNKLDNQDLSTTLLTPKSESDCAEACKNGAQGGGNSASCDPDFFDESDHLRLHNGVLRSLSAIRKALFSFEPIYQSCNTAEIFVWPPWDNNLESVAIVGDGSVCQASKSGTLKSCIPPEFLDYIFRIHLNQIAATAKEELPASFDETLPKELVFAQYNSQKDEIKDRLKQESILQIFKMSTLFICLFICIIYIVRQKSAENTLKDMAASGLQEMKLSRVAGSVFWLLVILNIIVDIRLSYNAELQTEIGRWVSSLEEQLGISNQGWETHLKNSGLFSGYFMKVGQTVLTPFLCALTIFIFVYQQESVTIRGSISNSTSSVNRGYFAAAMLLTIVVNKDWHFLSSLPMISIAFLGVRVLATAPKHLQTKPYTGSTISDDDRAKFNYAFPGARIGSYLSNKINSYYLEFSEDVPLSKFLEKKFRDEDSEKIDSTIYSYLHIKADKWCNFVSERSLWWPKNKLPLQPVTPRISDKKLSNDSKSEFRNFLITRGYQRAQSDVILFLKSCDLLDDNDNRKDGANSSDRPFLLRNLSIERDHEINFGHAKMEFGRYLVSAEDVYHVAIRDNIVPNDAWHVVAVLSDERENSNGKTRKQAAPQGDRNVDEAAVVFFCYKIREKDAKNRLLLN